MSPVHSKTFFYVVVALFIGFIEVFSSGFTVYAVNESGNKRPREGDGADTPRVAMRQKPDSLSPPTTETQMSEAPTQSLGPIDLASVDAPMAVDDQVRAVPEAEPDGPNGGVFSESALKFFEKGPLKDFSVHMFSSDSEVKDYKVFLTKNSQARGSTGDEGGEEDGASSGDSEGSRNSEPFILDGSASVQGVKGVVYLRQSMKSPPDWLRLMQGVFPGKIVEKVESDKPEVQETGALLFINLGAKEGRYYNGVITFGKGGVSLDVGAAIPNFGLHLQKGYGEDITSVQAVALREFNNPMTMQVSRRKPVVNLASMGIDELSYRVTSIKGHMEGFSSNVMGKHYLQYTPSFAKDGGGKKAEKTARAIDTIKSLELVCLELLEKWLKVSCSVSVEKPEEDKGKIDSYIDQLWEEEKQHIGDERNISKVSTFSRLAYQKLPEYPYMPVSYEVEGDTIPYITLKYLFWRYKERGENPLRKKVELIFSEDAECGRTDPKPLHEWLDAPVLEHGDGGSRLLQGVWHTVMGDVYEDRKKILEKVAKATAEGVPIGLPDFDISKDFTYRDKKKSTEGAEDEADDDSGAVTATSQKKTKRGEKILDEGAYNERVYRELEAQDHQGRRQVYLLDTKNIYMKDQEDRFEFSDLLVVDETEGGLKSYLLHVKRKWDRDPISTLLAQGRISALLLTDDFKMPRRVINKIIRSKVQDYFTDLDSREKIEDKNKIKVPLGAFETVEKQGRDDAIAIKNKLKRQEEALEKQKTDLEKFGKQLQEKKKLLSKKRGELDKFEGQLKEISEKDQKQKKESEIVKTNERIKKIGGEISKKEDEITETEEKIRETEKDITILKRLEGEFFGDRTGILEVFKVKKYRDRFLKGDANKTLDELVSFTKKHRDLLEPVFDRKNLKDLMVVFVVINDKEDRTMNLRHFTTYDFYESMQRIQKAGMQFGLMTVGSCGSLKQEDTQDTSAGGGASALPGSMAADGGSFTMQGGGESYPDTFGSTFPDNTQSTSMPN